MQPLPSKHQFFLPSHLFYTTTLTPQTLDFHVSALYTTVGITICSYNPLPTIHSQCPVFKSFLSPPKYFSCFFPLPLDLSQLFHPCNSWFQMLLKKSTSSSYSPFYFTYFLSSSVSLENFITLIYSHFLFQVPPLSQTDPNSSTVCKN